MRKICIVSGNRSDYSKIKLVLQAIEDHKDLTLQLIVMASHILPDAGKTIDNIIQDGFVIDAIARTIVEGEDPSSMAKSVGLGILELTTLFDIFNPDIVVVIGDRFEIFSAAISAALMNIFLAHIQGGEITGSIDESIRHSITKLSHIHFASTEKSAERIISMGEDPGTVINTGCPSIDLMNTIKIRKRSEICNGVGRYKIRINTENPFLLLIQHPVTTEYRSAPDQIEETLSAISEVGIQTIMIYPNIDAGSKDIIQRIRFLKDSLNLEKVYMYKHIFFEDFMNLLFHCSCIIGNSSSGIREACFYGTPVVNIGTRQKGRERGSNVIDVGYDKNEIKNAIISLIKKEKYPKEFIYGDGNASKKIAEILSTCDIKNIQKKLNY